MGICIYMKSDFILLVQKSNHRLDTRIRGAIPLKSNLLEGVGAVGGDLLDEGHVGVLGGLDRNSTLDEGKQGALRVIVAGNVMLAEVRDEGRVGGVGLVGGHVGEGEVASTVQGAVRVCCPNAVVDLGRDKRGLRNGELEAD